jgi:dimethylhistidine N-methyltransferase
VKAGSRDLAEEVARGLRSTPKHLPCRFFYDAAGSVLFEEICELPEYYLTRAEDEILAAHAAEIAASARRDCDLVELGSGSARKTRRLIRALLQLDPTLRYLPIDISRTALVSSAEALVAENPGLSILAVAAEYETALAKLAEMSPRRKLVLWLGSNVGNLSRLEAAAFLARLAGRFSKDDRLLIGIDLRKDRRVLESAYDDARGVTARFNRNLLVRVNTELAADFDPDRFRHVAFYDEREGRIEMHLESTVAQTVRIARLGLRVQLEPGERIHTENSYKYSRGEIEDLARDGGMRVERTWLDSRELFSLHLFAAVQDRKKAPAERDSAGASPGPIPIPGRTSVHGERQAPSTQTWTGRVS